MPEVVEGLDDLLRKLDTLPSLVSAKKAIARSLRKGAEPIRAEAQARAPRGDESPHMADTMMISVTEQTSSSAIAKIGPSKKGFYGMFAEFGTIHQSADPFLRSAFDRMIGLATSLIGTELAKQIEKAMRKAA